jgi:hypothetical protein
MGAFKKLTAQQRGAMDALRALGEMYVSPDDARSLRVMQRRGLVRFRRDEDGGRIAVLRENAVQKARSRREARQLRYIEETFRAFRPV